MVEASARLDDPALHALALAHRAGRLVESRPALDQSEATTDLLVRAVRLLDSESTAVVHRTAALIAVAIVSHSLGLWELAMEQYEQALAAGQDPCWTATVRRQRRAVAFNRVELALDWACAHAAIGDWDGARDRAAAILPGSLDAVDGDWPPRWVTLYRCHLHLLAAVAGSPGRASMFRPTPGCCA